MAELVKLMEIGRFRNDAKPGMVIRRIGSVSGGTPDGIVKGADYRIEAIEDGAYKLTRLSDGYQLETYLHGNEHRYSFVEKAAEAVPVKQSETLREINDPVAELTVGTVIRRTARETSHAHHGIKYGYDYRITASKPVCKGGSADLTLLCLKTHDSIDIVIGNTRERYRIVEQPAQQDAEPEAQTELDRFEAIYRILEAKGVESSKAVRSALEIVRMK